MTSEESGGDPLLDAIGMTVLDEPDGDILGYLEPTDLTKGAFLPGGVLGTCVEIFGWKAVALEAERKGFEGAEWWPVSFQVELLRAAEPKRHAIRGTAERIGRRHAFARVEIVPAEGGAAVTTGTVILVNAASS